jgi:LmbE family N-acetylglucosaminyl deacetylase
LAVISRWPACCWWFDLSNWPFSVSPMSPLGTLMLVHAHPDDEAVFTAGTSRYYADLGYRVVLVTCTNGRLGIDDQWLAGSDPEHHTDWVRRIRAGELVESAQIVGADRTVCLGYDDSGLEGWPQNSDVSAFVNQDVDAMARTLASIMDEERAVVVITYDENGYYGHPDHIMANVVTRRAIEQAKTVERLFYPVTPASVLEAFVPAARARGVYLPIWVIDAGAGLPDESVDVTIDATALAPAKQASIAAHASQVDNADLATMDADLFQLLFGREFYVLGWSRRSLPLKPDDLFGGLLE